VGLKIANTFAHGALFNNVARRHQTAIPRNVDTFHHKGLCCRTDIRYIKKNRDTRHGEDDFATLVKALRRHLAMPWHTLRRASVDPGSASSAFPS